jgi:uncharacterized membrane protein YdjX (TVP38/TMEM64 family)
LDTDSPGIGRRVSLVIGIAAVLGLAWFGEQRGAPHVLGLLARTRALGPWAPIAFSLVYAAAIVLLIPATPLTVVAGALFGFTVGVICAAIASTIGADAAFLLGRYTFRKPIARRLAAMPRYTAIEQAVSAKGRRIVFLLRLSPVMPFNFLNYALGLTTITLLDFTISSIGMMPGTLVYAYFGKVAGEALVLAGQAQVAHNASYYGALIAGLVATIGATTVVTRTARRALRDV